MKEKPIIFSTPMVQAILAGRKTQTRRLINPQPIIDNGSGYVFDGKHKSFYDIHEWKVLFTDEHCQYKKDDILWVRERIKRKKYGAYWDCDITSPEYECKYEADNSSIYFNWFFDREKFIENKLISPLFMFKYEARIWRKVTNVRCERLWDISEEDAIAEGVKPNSLDWKENGEWWNYIANSFDEFPTFSARESYKTLWESIHGANSWKQNPWVWRIEFEIYPMGKIFE